VIGHYTIDADHVVRGPMSFEEWLPWAITVEDWGEFIRLCRVGASVIDGDCRVSTVFLRGVDHQLWPGGPPLLFETMVFGGVLDREQERYSTWDEAEEGHRHWVELALGQPVS
jgi:hypothetical protein